MNFQKIKNFIMRNTFLRNLHSLRFNDLNLIYKPEDLTEEYYQKIKDLGDDELEHQIGRLTNFKNILKEIEEGGIGGDIIEFGTWRGFSLLWIAYWCERLGIFNKKIIGVDGFVGLPYGDGIFRKGAFSNASLKSTSRNILMSKDLYDATKRNILIKKALYAQKDQILSFVKGRRFSFIHIDCDVSRSAVEIFDIIRESKMLADKCFLLFDDYGCESNLKFEVDRFLEELRREYRVSEHSQTKLTKNFKLEKIHGSHK